MDGPPHESFWVVRTVGGRQGGSSVERCQLVKSPTGSLGRVGGRLRSTNGGHLPSPEWTQLAKGAPGPRVSPGGLSVGRASPSGAPGETRSRFSHGRERGPPVRISLSQSCGRAVGAGPEGAFGGGAAQASPATRSGEAAGGAGGDEALGEGSPVLVLPPPAGPPCRALPRPRRPPLPAALPGSPSVAGGGVLRARGGEV